MAALRLEARPPGGPYRSVDPHGFDVLGAAVITPLSISPVLWLPLRRRPPNVTTKAPVGRTNAVMLASGMPMLLQVTCLDMPFA